VVELPHAAASAVGGVVKFSPQWLFAIVDRGVLREYADFDLDRVLRERGLSRSDLNDRNSSLHWYYRADTMLKTNWSQRRRMGKIFPECRTSDYDITIHRRNKMSCHRLNRSSWPSNLDGRPVWPSSPTFNERLEMLRRGSPVVNQNPPYASRRVCPSEVKENGDLCVGIILNNVLGVRSDIPVPEKFLGYFRYRRGFLVLTAPGMIPIGLARFLCSHWCTDPNSLWLRRKEPLRKFLRAVPLRIYNSNADEC